MYDNKISLNENQKASVRALVGVLYELSDESILARGALAKIKEGEHKVKCCAIGAAYCKLKSISFETLFEMSQTEENLYIKVEDELGINGICVNDQYNLFNRVIFLFDGHGKVPPVKIAEQIELLLNSDSLFTYAPAQY